ncbi:MAG: RsmE family RNA methyltransferase [Gemmatimonadetes bacterium]|nr:RsmE family RNA methyltransferase [Gemmatimonadota bacterium]
MTTRIEDDTAAHESRPTLLHRQLEHANEGAEVELDAAEVEHIRVLRLRRGAAVTLTDGRGRRWISELSHLERRSARCRLVSRRSDEKRNAVALWIPVASRDRTLWLVEKSVELGVGALRWIEWERSRSVADGARSATFLERARRRAEAAVKQSRGAWLPPLEPVVPLADALRDTAAEASVRWLADVRGTPVSALRRPIANAGEATTTLLVGPEGGGTAAELDACAAAGFELVSLGSRTLRFETAAIALLVAASALFEPNGDVVTTTRGTEER